MIWHQRVSLDILNQRSEGTMAEHLSICFTQMTDESLTATMPVDKRTRQPLGIMNGGASCVLAETVGSTAANFCVDINTHYCVGLTINTNHIHSIKEGRVSGIATPFHLGKSTQVWGITIKDSMDKLISVSRLTMAVLPRKQE